MIDMEMIGARLFGEHPGHAQDEHAELSDTLYDHFRGGA